MLKLSVISTIAITGITTVENIHPKITNASQKVKSFPKSYQGKWYFNTDPDTHDTERNFNTLVVKKDKVTWISSTNGGVMKYKFKINGKNSKGFKLKPISKKPFPGNDYSLKITNDSILFNYGSGTNTFCKDKAKYIEGNSGPKYPLNSTESIDSDYYMLKNYHDNSQLKQKADDYMKQVSKSANNNDDVSSPEEIVKNDSNKTPQQLQQESSNKNFQDIVNSLNTELQRLEAEHESNPNNQDIINAINNTKQEIQDNQSKIK